MNRSESKFNLKTFLTLLFVLTLTFVMAFTVACSNNSSTENKGSDNNNEKPAEQTDTKTDKQTLNNGDFEFYTTKDSSYPVYSTSTSSSYKWRKVTDGKHAAPSSTAASGIIDTTESAYASLSDTNKPADKSNPGTPVTDNDADTQADESGKKILMIHNKTSDGFGTAQYFQSTATLSPSHDETARVSVWVKTADISTRFDDSKSGAYIKITNTVGGKDEEALVIKNIRTDGAWVKYTVYLTPSDYAATQYKVILGLGEGSKTSVDNFAEGFAYFDNAEYKILDKDADIAALTASAHVVDVTDKDSFSMDAATETTKVAYVNFAKGSVPVADMTGSGKFNEEITPNTLNTDFEAGYTATDKTLTLGGETETVNNAVYMVFEGKGIGSSYTYTSKNFDLVAPTTATNYVKFSFNAKVKTANGSQTGATVQLVDGTKDGSSLSTFTEEYKRYTFYLANVYNEKLNNPADYAFTYAFKFSFGPTSNINELQKLPVGYAVFKDFNVTYLTAEEYEKAATGSDAVKAELKNDYLNAYSEEKTDDEAEETYDFSVGAIDKKLKLEKGIAVDVSGDSYSVKTESADSVVGIVNSKYAAEYTTEYGAEVTAALQDLDDAKWTGRTNKHVQPMMVKGAATIAANYATIPAGGTYSFSVNVYAFGSAKGFVRIYKLKTIDEEGGVLKNASGNETSVTVENGATRNTNGYVLVTFVIKAKTELKVRVEFGNTATGAVFFDNVNAGTAASYSDFAALKSAYPDYDFTTKSSEQTKVYTYNSKEDAEKENNESLRVKENGEVVYRVIAPVVKEALGKPAVENAADNAFIQYADLDDSEVYDIKASGDKSDESDNKDSDNSANNSDRQAYGWLSVVSIILAVVLIAALVAIIVRKSLKKRAGKKEKTKAYYGGYNKSKASAYSTKGSKKSDIQAPDKDDEEKAYDYDNPENN